MTSLTACAEPFPTPAILPGTPPLPNPSLVRALFPPASLALLLSLLCLPPAPLQSQNTPITQTLTGRVLDSLTQAPVLFATVYLDGTTIGATTDEEGRFSLPIPSEYLPATLVVSQLNYATWRGDLTTIAPGPRHVSEQLSSGADGR